VKKVKGELRAKKKSPFIFCLFYCRLEVSPFLPPSPPTMQSEKYKRNGQGILKPHNFNINKKEDGLIQESKSNRFAFIYFAFIQPHCLFLS
jgi:hypothetical protein